MRKIEGAGSRSNLEESEGEDVDGRPLPEEQIEQKLLAAVDPRPEIIGVGVEGRPVEFGRVGLQAAKCKQEVSGMYVGSEQEFTQREVISRK